MGEKKFVEVRGTRFYVQDGELDLRQKEIENAWENMKDFVEIYDIPRLPKPLTQFQFF